MFFGKIGVASKNKCGVTETLSKKEEFKYKKNLHEMRLKFGSSKIFIYFIVVNQPIISFLITVDLLILARYRDRTVSVTNI